MEGQRAALGHWRGTYSKGQGGSHWGPTTHAMGCDTLWPGLGPPVPPTHKAPPPPPPPAPNPPPPGVCGL